MSGKFALTPPFFEIGPKLYLHGGEAVKLAVFADQLVDKYGVDILFTVQCMDIAAVAKATKRIRILAQHMDCASPGRGLGSILPEAVADAGAHGVMLNHAEKPLTLGVLNRTIKRAKEVGLASVVCADTPEEALAVAHLEPDVILVESPLMIEGGKRTQEERAAVAEINHEIWKINPDIRVLHGAGISDERDVYGVIACGAQGTGSTSGIMKAADPYEMTEKMIAAVREAWEKEVKHEDRS